MTSSFIGKSLLVDASGNPYVGGSGATDTCAGIVGLQSLTLGEISKPSLTTQGAFYSEPLITFETRRILDNNVVLINGATDTTNQGPIVGGNTSTSIVFQPYGTGVTVSFELNVQNANDTSLGTGAREVTVEGLDGSYNPISETRLLAGATNLTLVNTYNHINNFYVSDAGSGGNAAGNIIVRTSSGSIAFGYITPAFQTTGFYKCPKGKRAVLAKTTYSCGTLAATWNIIVWRKDATCLTNFARFDSNLQVDFPTVVLEEGDSVYCYQNSNNVSKVLMTFYLYDA